MTAIHLILNNGRNVGNIYRDTLRLLAGCTVNRITLICLREDEIAFSPDPSFSPLPNIINVEYIVVGVAPDKYTSGPVGEGCDEIVVVANGGTTRQQFVGYEIYSQEREEWIVSRALREESRHKPVRLIDVQRDGCVLLARV